jgi:alkanesulfonate monooxygenase SsuD/methylene tetrahydromethanopterin reductase-like flavin-dependent oxidoreductase (luciferase family)
MAPRFGFSVDFRNPKQWFQPWGRFYSEYIDFIAWTETIGYEQVWLPEHHASSDDGYPPSPFVLAAGLATRTRTMRIGTAVALR